MTGLEESIIDLIINAEDYDRFVSPPMNQNCAPCLNYVIGNVTLQIPYNGCTSYAVIVNKKTIGRIERDLVNSYLDDMKNRIQENLIKSIGSK